ncbi:beta-ketoacyl synthase domain-containing protein [Colletotrichum graminicola]|nr:beta-ketoacyl synthase domain-containing protein [Colletotrichum graminicola]
MRPSAMAFSPRPADKPLLLVFGALALSMDISSISRIREATSRSRQGWLQDIVSGLPADYTTCRSVLSSLGQDTSCYEAGVEQLDDLTRFFSRDVTGQEAARLAASISFPLPNKLLIPLVVVAQLTQYAEFLARTGIGHGQQSPGPDTAGGTPEVEAVGCCVGLLSAFVASSSKNEAQFKMHAAAAIRLGMLIGSVVDIFEGQDGPKSGAISISWDLGEDSSSSSSVPSTLDSILADFPQTYISNHHDRNRVTITGPLHTLSSLRHRLEMASNMSSTNTPGLHGRYHDSRHSTSSLDAFCETHPEFQLPDASVCRVPPRLNSNGGRAVHGGRLHQHALRAILVEKLRWFETFQTVRREFLRDGEIVVFGLERPIPPSMSVELATRVDYSYMAAVTGIGYSTTPGNNTSPDGLPYSENDIAVVGMSAKVAGADSLEAFWDVLCAGVSQHSEVSPDRFGGGFGMDKSMFRTAAPNRSRKWFANFLSGPDEFDHRFFGKSPRESAAMDPQQRHMLQVAYQAVEQAGYFNSKQDETNGRVGCFVGCSTCDYEQNIACHDASAFSATGQLRAFIAGKVSHYFGWTGPGVTIDTACSSSAVAVHQACQAILAGDCDAALAGGAFVMCGPQWFQDLAGASFLSPTGQCKPFDAGADGYCRGDGVAAVFLKRMDKALADGDEILGVIGATVVQQNQNSTPIVVPNEASLSDLFKTVLDKAGVQPGQVSVIEAHGTGTAVGDPAEYGAIRQVFGASSKRQTPLSLGSVKGSIGHTECTAGVLSLIKVILMMCNGRIPPQASFNTINPSLNASPADMIEIHTGSDKAWDAPSKAALVNSYGASGSNACILVKQPPPPPPRVVEAGKVALAETGDRQFPFWLSGHDEEGLRRGAGALRKFISGLGRKTTANNNNNNEPPSMAKISASVYRQKSHALRRALFVKASTLDELERKLQAYEHAQLQADTSTSLPTPKPVILCFGGQVSTSVGLDRDVFERMAILRKHLNEVDAVATAQGVGSIYPSIFETTPVADPVKLQVALLALQYACARSWMDCGITPAAVVGHSFGEITAACVAGVLSLRDAVKLVVRRASLVRDRWGPDRGAMLAVEADLADVQGLIAESGGQVAVACYNGPRSFTLAGSTAAIEAVAQKAALTCAAARGARPFKAKVLNVTHAFHSVLVEPHIVEELERCAQTLTFQKPKIHMEKADELGGAEDKERLGPAFLPRQMRNPVYFHHAIERLAEKHQSTGAIFLEAGSASTVTSLASRALVGQSDGDYYKFQPVIITSTRPATSSAKCWDGLVDATIKLWTAGAGPALQFWAHHPLQTKNDPSPPLLLPPYQFEPSRHWLDRLPPPRELSQEEEASAGTDKTSATGLVCFTGLADDGNSNKVRFRVVSDHPRYKKLVNGHHMARTAGICPVFVQLDLVIQALCMTLRTPVGLENNGHSNDLLIASGQEPHIHNVVCLAPLCDNPARMVWLEISPASTSCSLLRSANGGDEYLGGGDGDNRGEISFELYSTDMVDDPLASNLGLSEKNKILHTSGEISLASRSDPAAKRDIEQFARLVNMGQITQLLHSSAVDLDISLSHDNVYHMFEEVVEYCAEYRGIQRLVSRNNQSVAIVNRQVDDGGSSYDGRHSWLQPCVADTLAQVAGIWMNCLAVDREPGCLYVFSGLERWLRAPSLDEDINGGQPSDMHLLATHHRTSNKTAVSDVFAFDSRTGKLLEVILGVGWAKVPRSHMQKTLVRCAGAQRTGLAAQGLASDPTGAGATEAAAAGAQYSNLANHQKMEDKGQRLAPSGVSHARSPLAVTGGADTLDVAGKLKSILVELSGIETCNLTDDSELADLGIDSLMNMELASEIRTAFKLRINEGALLEAATVADLTLHVRELVETQNPGVLARGNTASSIPASSVLAADADNTKWSSPTAGSEPDLSTPTSPPSSAVVMEYVRTMTQGWAAPLEMAAAADGTITAPRATRTQDRVVVVTGGTGGLGAHLVVKLATDPSVARVVCLNRRKPNNNSNATARQLRAILTKTGIDLGQARYSAARAKLDVLETDLSQPALGLDPAAYLDLTRSVGEIVHNCWLMSLGRDIGHFEPQLRIMRHMLDLARDAALRQPPTTTTTPHAITFQFVSSVAVVGHAPAGAVPEERVRGIESVLAAGYAEAKWACELMMDATLHRWPAGDGMFRAMVVRLGQIAASRVSGYWNAGEHVSFIIKSSQTLGVLPRLGGVLTWTPVEDVAGALTDLLVVAARPYAVYHVDNPVRQPWADMIAVLARELGLDDNGGECAVPFAEWVRRVREVGPRAGNPAYVLVDFLEANFMHISCGGLLLETSHSREHSPTMRQVGPFGQDLTRLFIRRWKESGFLSP